MTVDAHFVMEPGSRDVNLHVELVDGLAPPVATIASLSNGRPECSGPEGATVTLQASASTSGTEPPAYAWLLRTPDGITSINNTLSATFTVPLLPSLESGNHVASFTVFDGNRSATAEAPIQVVDTVPPIIDGATIDVPCNWILHPTNPPACLRLTGHATDRCSASIEYQVLSVSAFDDFTGELLREVVQPTCIERLNGFATVGESLSRVRYALRWLARDAWGNASRPHVTEFFVHITPVRPDDPPGRCGADGDLVADIFAERDE